MSRPMRGDTAWGVTRFEDAAQPGSILSHRAWGWVVKGDEGNPSEPAGEPSQPRNPRGPRGQRPGGERVSRPLRRIGGAELLTQTVDLFLGTHLIGDVVLDPEKVHELPTAIEQRLQGEAINKEFTILTVIAQ